MKAFDLIKTLFDGWLNLEQGGVFVMAPETDEQFVQRFFGEHRVISGKLVEGEYVYFYGPEHDKLVVDYPPDVVLVTKDDESIMLWRVE